MLAFIASNSRMHMKTSMKTVKERFLKAPYGFVEDDVQWLVAKLFRNGDIDFTVNGSGVSRLNKSEDDLVGFITKKQFVEKLLMEEHIRVGEKEKKAVREVMKELFHVTGATDDEETMMINFQKYADSMITSIERLEVKYDKYAYPGRKILADGKKLLQSVSQIQAPAEFYQAVAKRRDDFLDFAEDYEPVRAFFAGEQLEIFTRALDMLAIYEDSKSYIVDKTLEDAAAQMRAIVRMDKPYGSIPKLPGLRKEFMDAYMKVLEDADAPVLKAIDLCRARVMEVLSTKIYADEMRPGYAKAFDELREGAEHCNNVSTLRSFADKANALKIRFLNEMVAMDSNIEEQERKNRAKQEQKEGKAEPVTQPVKPIRAPKKVKNISMRDLLLDSHWRVESRGDVKRILEELEHALLQELQDSDIIDVEF